MPRFSSKPTSPASHPVPPTITGLSSTNSLGTVSSDDQMFVPPLAANESTCPNEQKRAENNSSRLPECRAYELVTNRPKGGFSANLSAFSESETVAYQSNAGNIEESGQGIFFGNYYVAKRTDSGWETLAHLNGPKGTPYYPRGSLQWQFFAQYSPDLERSIWWRGIDGKPTSPYLRESNGEFIPMSTAANLGGGAEGYFRGASQDLSHTFWIGMEFDGAGECMGPRCRVGDLRIRRN